MTTVTFSTRPLIRRGDYLSNPHWRGRVSREAVNDCITVRNLHDNRIVEWLHAHYEDWLAWPLADLRACVSSR